MCIPTKPIATGTTVGHRQLTLGSIKLPLPAVQAALSGYSDWPMRVLARRMGAPYAIHEVMIDRFVNQLTSRRRTERFTRVTDEEHPVAAQLMGADPDEFGPAAIKLVDAGFDVIDVNFGCPVKKMLGRCRGGYHLSQPKTAREILSRVRESVPDGIPVTLKMRRGIDDSQESTDQFFTILDAAFQSGYAAVTVHGRTVQQKYVGTSCWEFLRQAKRHAGDRTILGSGDLFSARCCVDMLNFTGVDGVSIARGAIGNPWIFSRLKVLLSGQPLPDPPTVHEQLAVLNEHHALTLEIHNPEKAASRMRRFAIYYARLHPDHQAVRIAFTRVRTVEDWNAVLESHYSEDRAGQHPPVDEPNEHATCRDQS
jgi:nifR3 family TIM-barrel protein